MPRLAKIVALGVCSAVRAVEAADDHAHVAASEFPSHDPCPSNAAPSNQVQGKVEMWIDLSAPPLSTIAGDDHEARAHLRRRIEEQQNEVMRRLAALGAEERARVLEVRNAIAVLLPSSALAEARAIPGVKKVRVVKHRKRTPRCSSRN